jgi:hypothetical protein
MPKPGARQVSIAHPAFLVLAALLAVGTIGSLIGDVLAHDTSAFDIAARAVTGISWLTIFAVGAIGRRRERREQAEADNDSDER